MNLIESFKNNYEPFDLNYIQKIQLASEANKYLRNFKVLISKNEDSKEGDYYLSYKEMIIPEASKAFSKETNIEIFLMVIGKIDIQKIKYNEG